MEVFGNDMGGGLGKHLSQERAVATSSLRVGMIDAAGISADLYPRGPPPKKHVE